MRCVLTISSSGSENSDKVQLKTADNDSWNEFCRVADILALKLSEPSPFVLARTVTVDAQVEPGLFYPFLNGDALESVVALLMLAFPDVKFRFTNVKPSKYPNNDLTIAAAAFHASGKFADFPDSFAPVFDPYGLRAWILWRHGGEELFVADASPGAERTDDRVLLPNRIQQRGLKSVADANAVAMPTAVVLEDESEFALFAGYVCYRSGYLTQTISSWRAAEARLAGNTTDPAIPPSPLEGSPTLAVEDIWLNFNAGKDIKLEDRAVRYGLLPKLKGVFHVTISSADWKDSNRDEPYVLVRKPLPGVFSFWKSASSSNIGLRKDVYSPGPTPGPVDHGGDHPSPDRVVALAEFMVGRARRLLPDVQSMLDATTGAVLAGDALDLLVGRAVTSALEALSLKHQFEVLAECRFMGVRAEIDIGDRFAEIAVIAKAIVDFIEPARDRESVANSALMNMATDIARIFQEHGRFQEEQDSLSYQRRYLDRFLRAQANPWSKTKGVLLIYPHLLLRSLSTFVLVLVAWASSLTLIHLLLRPVHDTTSNVIGGYGLYLAYTIGSFMSFELWSGDPHSLWRLCAITVGVFHFGVLLTYLYSAVSRK